MSFRMLLAGPFCSLSSGCLELLDHIAMMMLLWSHSLLVLALCFSTRTWLSHFCDYAEVRAGEDAFCRETHVFSAWDSWNSGLQRIKTSYTILGMERALAKGFIPLRFISVTSAHRSFLAFSSSFLCSHHTAPEKVETIWRCDESGFGFLV